MKVIVLAALVAAVALPAAAADVGVSVQISEPGVYGRIDIGRFPQPALVMPQPVVIQPAPRHVHVQPMYLWVPPGHQKDWRKHCGRYNACGVPVYFVQEGWYQQHVMARGGGGHRHDRHDRHDDRHDDHPGKGHGKGHGKHKD